MGNLHEGGPGRLTGARGRRAATFFRFHRRPPLNALLVSGEGCHAR
jgi:hypothetical protein